MDKKRYITPQSTVVFCEERILEAISTWTDEPLGKDNTFEEEDNGDNSGNVWDSNFNPFNKNPFGDSGKEE